MTGKADQKITILATSDIHGRFIPQKVGTISPTPGSLAQFSLLARSVRQHDPNVIVLDCGDLFRDSAQAFLLSRPATQRLRAEFLARIGYDAVTPGNHDIPGMDFPSLTPLINCNADVSGAIPYIIIRKGDKKVAVIGVLTDEQPVLADGTIVRDPVSSLRMTLDSLQATVHPDMFIGLFHAGREEVERFSDSCPEIDLIIYGHDHQSYIGQTQNGTPLVNPGAYGKTAALITVEEGHISPAIISLSEFEADGKILEILEQASNICGSIDSPLTVIPDTSSLIHVLHKIIHCVTGAPVTAVPPISATAPIYLSISEIYRLFPYDDYAGVSVRSGKEIRESGLDVMIHVDNLILDDTAFYRVGCDSHSLQPTEGITLESIQSLLADALAGKSYDKLRDHAAYHVWHDNNKVNSYRHNGDQH